MKESKQITYMWVWVAGEGWRGKERWGFLVASVIPDAEAVTGAASPRAVQEQENAVVTLRPELASRDDRMQCAELRHPTILS